MALDFFQVLIIVFALSVGVIVFFHRFRVPAIVGFLLTGVIAGPSFLGVAAGKEIEVLAEIGVILLMFTIGLEFNIKSLVRLRKPLLVGGFLQVALTTGVIAFIGLKAGLVLGPAVVLGFVVALSSTAIIMKLLQERAEVDSPHGQVVLAICIFQDMAAVLLMLFLPSIGGEGGSIFMSLVALMKGVFLVGAAIACAIWIVPKALAEVARTRNREVFLLAVIVLCFAVAGLCAYAGLSVALGAFLAGLVLSESVYGHQALANVLPFRDLFMSLFFVSVGMLLDVQVVRGAWLLILGMVVGIVVLKFLAAGIAGYSLGIPSRYAALVGVALSPMSEFGFIISSAAVQHNVFPQSLHALMLVVSVATMAAAPLLFMLSPRIADSVSALPIRNGVVGTSVKRRAADTVIIGFGPVGQATAAVLKKKKVSYAIIDMNPQRVNQLKAEGEFVVFGDATSSAVIEAAGVQNAKHIIVAILDSISSVRIVRSIRACNASARITACARYLTQTEELVREGATTVINAESLTAAALARQLKAR